MGKFLFNTLTAVSSILFAITIALGLESALYYDYVQHRSPTATIRVVSALGGVHFTVTSPQSRRRRRATTVPTWEWGHVPIRQRRSSLRHFRNRMLDWNVMGLGFGHQAAPVRFYSLLVPYWLLMILFAILPAMGLVIYLRRNRPGICRDCGFDLQGNPRATTCPECGGPLR